MAADANLDWKVMTYRELLAAHKQVMTARWDMASWMVAALGSCWTGKNVNPIELNPMRPTQRPAYDPGEAARKWRDRNNAPST